jgi:DNA-binding transcriptional ArsR family regulator
VTTVSPDTDTTQRQADVDKIAAMAHPVRRRLLDLLAVDGPATVGSLADRSGERVGSVSHHLKMLARAGLVEEAPELARDRRESWWRVVRASWAWSVTDFDGDPAGKVVADAAERDQLRACVEKAHSWFDHRTDYDRPWREAAFSTTTWLNLTADELTELGRRIAETMRDFARDIPDDDQERDSVYVFAYALPAQP